MKKPSGTRPKAASVEQRERPPEAVQEVVDTDRARMELALREAAAGAEEERQVRAEAEDGDLPVAGAVLHGLEDGRREQEGGQDPVARRRTGRLGAIAVAVAACVVIQASSGRWLTLLASMANGVSPVKCFWTEPARRRDGWRATLPGWTCTRSPPAQRRAARCGRPARRAARARRAAAPAPRRAGTLRFRRCGRRGLRTCSHGEARRRRRRRRAAAGALSRCAPGTRIADAVAAAGGATAKADLAAVNLAAPVADGEQIVVPAARRRRRGAAAAHAVADGAARPQHGVARAARRAARASARRRRRRSSTTARRTARSTRSPSSTRCRASGRAGSSS